MNPGQLHQSIQTWLGFLILNSDFWDPHWKQISDSVFNSEDYGRIVFLKFWCLESQKIGIPIWDIRNSGICLRRNSVPLIVANLYWLQSMYNDLILMVHKLVAPLQHLTAADQHHVISWHCQCNSCHWPAILDRWCNQFHWCASGKKQVRSWARNCHPFSAPRNQCATTTWSWPSCREVEYNRHLLYSPRGMQTYSYWDGDDENDGNTCSLWGVSADESKIQDMVAPKDVDQHRDSTDQFTSSPPCQLQ
jgi:hypothetical protein